MSKEQTTARLRARAAKYRILARASNDDETASAGFKLAAELEQQARDLDRGK
jgi:hypothetical protein